MGVSIIDGGKDCTRFIAAEAIRIGWLNFVSKNLEDAPEYFVCTGMGEGGVDVLKAVDIQQRATGLGGLSKTKPYLQVWKPVSFRPQDSEIVADTVSIENLVTKAVEAKTAALGDEKVCISYYRRRSARVSSGWHIQFGSSGRRLLSSLEAVFFG